jgi:hypothetical protein
MLELVMTVWMALATVVAPTPEVPSVEEVKVSAPTPVVRSAQVATPAPTLASQATKAAPTTVAGHVDARPADGSPTPPCENDEAIGKPCFWDANTMGNRAGTSFVASDVENVSASGDEQAVVTVQTPDGHTFTYGGSATEAASLAAQGEVFPNPDYPEEG